MKLNVRFECGMNLGTCVTLIEVQPLSQTIVSSKMLQEEKYKLAQKPIRQITTGGEKHFQTENAK